jgi:hypothetical protein
MDLQSIGVALVHTVQTNILLDLTLILLLVTLCATFLLSRRVSQLTAGTTGASLEGTILKLNERVATMEKHAHTTEEALNNIDARLQRTIRGVSVRRYDPFENAGGQQSFTSALIDEQGDGIVISGIHARDSVRVYAKEVHQFGSDRELSEDERAAIVDAKKRLQ